MKTTSFLMAVGFAAAAGVGGWYLGQTNAPAAAGPAQPAVTISSNANAAAAPGSSSASESAAESAKALKALAKKARTAMGGGGGNTWEDKLPEFTDPTAGARSPHTSLGGLRIGFSTLEESRQHLEKLGYVCRNASVRAMMGQMRERKVAEIEKVKAEGGDPDGVSGASWVNRQTKHEKNPQVRLACDKVDISRLPDRERPSATGRVLALFDSETLPLRRLVINRGFADAASARADLLASIDYHAGRFGAPHLANGAVPAEGEKFTPYGLVRREWHYVDADVKVSVLDLGRGPRVTEEVGVPWPVRPDAPAMSHAGR